MNQVPQAPQSAPNSAANPSSTALPTPPPAAGKQNTPAASTQQSPSSDQAKKSDSPYASIFPEEKQEAAKPEHSSSTEANTMAGGAGADFALQYPEGLDIDPIVAGDFKKLCASSGISSQQAQALLDWQLEAQNTLTQNFIEKGAQNLRQKWGARYEGNTHAALGAVTLLDKRMEGRLGKALAHSGMANMPEFVEAMHLISTMISEERLGAATPPARPSSSANSTREIYTRIFGDR